MRAEFKWQSIEDFVKEALGQKWAEERLGPFPVPRSFLSFFTRERRWSNSTDIELVKVKGTFHPDYIGMTWGEFLQKGKRMGPNLSMLASNPAYYLEEGHKEPTMSYLLHEGNYWIYADGNHRTCIGRFYLDLTGMEKVLKGVETWEMKLDLEAYSKWNQAGGIHGPLSVDSEIIARDDGPGWMKERFELKYFINQNRVEREEFLAFEEKSKAGWRRIFQHFFKGMTS